MTWLVDRLVMLFAVGGAVVAAMVLVKAAWQMTGSNAVRWWRGR